MPKTEQEINAEKAHKSRPDLVPATATLLLIGAPNPRDPSIADAHQHLVWFRRNLDREHLARAMLHVNGAIGESTPAALLCAGEVMGYGFRKHGRCTWRVAGTEQADPQTHLASAERHLLEYLADQHAVEEGSGLSVLWHAFSQLCILYDLIVDPPKIVGVNDGRGMVGERPTEPEDPAPTEPSRSDFGDPTP